METIAYHPLLEVQQEELKKIRQAYDLDDSKKIKECLEAIEEWCQKQPHLIEAFQYLRNDVLERLFLLSRGSIEVTKIKIDKFLTMRGMMPEITMNKSFEEFEKFLDCAMYVPLPKLCPTDQSRVLVTTFASGKIEQFNLLSFIRYTFMVGEYRMYNDYNFAERFIVDFKNININILTKLNPVILKKGEILATEGFGTKIKGIHILNAPSFIDKLVIFIKQGLKEKVAKRLHIHATYEELYNEIPKEILPKDYGGDGPSCDTLAEQWKLLFKTEESKKIIEQCNKLVADESKRSSVKFNAEYLGLPGSFRRLDVD